MYVYLYVHKTYTPNMHTNIWEQILVSQGNPKNLFSSPLSAKDLPSHGFPGQNYIKQQHR